MLWMYIHFPMLSIDLCERAVGHTRAIIITDTRLNRVLLSNKVATDAGIQPSQSVSTASCLHDELFIKAYDHNELPHALKEIAHWLYQHCANIVITPPTGILLEITSMQRLYESVSHLWCQLESGLQQQGYTPQLSVGLSPASSAILAKSGRSLCTDHVPTIRKALNESSISYAALPPAIIDKLHRMGLHNIASILRIPRIEIRKRLGLEVSGYLAKLVDDNADPQDFYEPPSHFERSIDLLAEIENTAGLRFPVNRLVQDLEHYLRLAQCTVTQFEILLQHRDRQQTQVCTGISSATLQANEAIRLVSLQLEQTKLPAAVTRIILVASELHPLTTHQVDLFQERGSTENQFQLLDRLHAKLGKDSLYTLAQVEEQRPEKTYTKTFPQIHRTRTSQLTSATASSTEHKQPLKRPLWILQEPYPLYNTPLLLIDDTERISAGWWSTEAINRDYYMARFTGNEIGWVFRNSQGEWFLHGWFA